MKRSRYVASVLLAVVCAADAQYRWRDADGQVNYGDVPPLDARDLQRLDARSPTVGNETGTALPFELRRAMARYPTVLYTSGECPACDSARLYLRKRGIPYSERTVEAPEDMETLRRLTGGDKVPALTLGAAQLQGFNSVEWARALDAAGYPADSRLPPGYVGEPPQPIVAPGGGPAKGTSAVTATR